MIKDSRKQKSNPQNPEIFAILSRHNPGIFGFGVANGGLSCSFVVGFDLPARPVDATVRSGAHERPNRTADPAYSYRSTAAPPPFG